MRAPWRNIIRKTLFVNKVHPKVGINIQQPLKLPKLTKIPNISFMALFSKSPFGFKKSIIYRYKM